jgi:hypothetical protein
MAAVPLERDRGQAGSLVTELSEYRFGMTAVPSGEPAAPIVAVVLRGGRTDSDPFPLHPEFTSTMGVRCSGTQMALDPPGPPMAYATEIELPPPSTGERA